MREILFRGERVDNGQWIYGCYIKATHHWHNNGIHEDWIATDTIQNGGWCNVRGKYAIIPDTIGQYTGLIDKNGTKIFEGDIVKVYCDADGHFDTRKEVFGKVIFDDDTFYDWEISYNHIRYGCEESMCNHRYNIEVIGNVHDNPELLDTPQDEVR